MFCRKINRHQVADSLSNSYYHHSISAKFIHVMNSQLTAWRREIHVKFNEMGVSH